MKTYDPNNYALVPISRRPTHYHRRHRPSSILIAFATLGVLFMFIFIFSLFTPVEESGEQFQSVVLENQTREKISEEQPLESNRTEIINATWEQLENFTRPVYTISMVFKDERWHHLRLPADSELPGQVSFVWWGVGLVHFQENYSKRYCLSSHRAQEAVMRTWYTKKARTHIWVRALSQPGLTLQVFYYPPTSNPSSFNKSNQQRARPRPITERIDELLQRISNEQLSSKIDRPTQYKNFRNSQQHNPIRQSLGKALEIHDAWTIFLLGVSDVVQHFERLAMIE